MPSDNPIVTYAHHWPKCRDGTLMEDTLRHYGAWTPQLRAIKEVAVDRLVGALERQRLLTMEPGERVFVVRDIWRTHRADLADAYRAVCPTYPGIEQEVKPC